VAAEHPWYAELLDSGGSEEPPPLVTRELLDRHTVDGVETDDQIAFTTSGAASGKPRRVPWNGEEMALNNDLKRRQWASHVGERDRVAIDVGLGLATHSASSVFTSLGCQCLELPFDLQVGEHIRALAEFFPDVLYSMPSIVDALLAEGRLVRSIERLILVGEPCSDVWMKLTADRLGITVADILDTYGCAEVGLIACGCPVCGRMHFVDEVIPEVVPPDALNDEWSAEALGEAESVLVVTSRFRTGLPIVRFVTYDIVRNFGLERCGESMRLGVDAVLGRIGDEIKHGERISVYDIERGVLAVTSEGRYQIVRGRDGRARLEFDAATIDDQQALAISEAVTATVAAAAAMTNSKLVSPFEVKRVVELASPGPSPKRKIVRERV
jgi:phenylacetate-coenzyme A ligase PaaK-like adenylate-forming protein